MQAGLFNTRLKAVFLRPHGRHESSEISRRRLFSLSASSSSSSSSLSPKLSTSDYFSASDKRPVVLYDGVCNLCNGGVNFLLTFDRSARLRMAALQSDPGRALLQRCGRQPDDISSIVLVTESGFHIKSEAVLRIGRELGGLWTPLADVGLAFPLGFRDVVYDLVAENRYNLLGKRDQCRLLQPGEETRFLW